MSITKDYIRGLLGDLENDSVERTISTTNTDKFGQAICAFANDLPCNNHPGYLIIGAEDDGSLHPIHVTDELLKNIAGIRTDGNIQPQPSMTVQKLTFPEGDIVVVEVYPTKMPPVKYKGRIWVRIGPRKGVANEDDERRLYEKRVANITTFDAMPCIGATVDDLDIAMFRQLYLPKAVPEDVLREDGRDVELQLQSGSPQKTTQERSIWEVEEMRAALDSMEDPILHLAVHLTLVGALREGEVAGLTPEDIDFDAANGMGTFTVNRSMQRVQKDTLAQVDKGCILRIFPDKLEGSKTSLILKDTKTEASCRTIFMTAALREELKQWLERLKREEALDPERYRNSGMLLRLPNGLAVEPVLIRKKFLKWQDAHPEFPRIVFHGLRHSSATYQLMISGGDIKAVQGTTGHASADMLVNTYAHIQQSSRVELGKKFESGFYAKPDTPSPQAVPAAGEPTISMTALLELLKDADPEMKAKLRLALLT